MAFFVSGGARAGTAQTAIQTQKALVRAVTSEGDLRRVEVVANRDVRLVGMIRDDTEKRVLEHLVRQTFGAREVINELET